MNARPKVRLPHHARRVARRVRAAALDARLALSEGRRWRRLRAAPVARGKVSVFYGHDRLPTPDEVAFGGLVKFQLLAAELPNEPEGFNVLYLGSSSLPLDARMLVRVARRRGAAFVWNQNGVAYPGWAGPDFARLNRTPARLLHLADHVFFQTVFCKVAADRFLGERREGWEVLPNPVDTTRFVPAVERPSRPLTLLLGGNQYQRYRLETALAALAALPAARLLVTGALTWSPDADREGRALAVERGLGERVDFVGRYTQRGAPEMLRRADVLLHTKYNDPCPTIVLEAMACGLPVVYSASGGVPELVGDEAGVGVPAPLDWERDHPPDPAALAHAVETVEAGLADYRDAARRRAVERFDARRWIERHRQVLAELVG